MLFLLSLQEETSYDFAVFLAYYLRKEILSYPAHDSIIQVFTVPIRASLQGYCGRRKFFPTSMMFVPQERPVCHLVFTVIL